MNQILLKQATQLANRPYRYEVRLDETTTGEPIYFASCQDIEGCHAQGQTPEEARHNLILARADFIYSLLEDGLPVPEPTSFATVSTAGAQLWEAVVTQNQEHAVFSVFQLVSAR